MIFLLLLVKPVIPHFSNFLILPQIGWKCKCYLNVLTTIPNISNVTQHIPIYSPKLHRQSFFCFVFTNPFHVLPALDPAPDQYMPAYFKSRSISGISSPAYTWYVIGFSVRSIDCHQKICDLSSQRCFLYTGGLQIYPSRKI